MLLAACAAFASVAAAPAQAAVTVVDGTVQAFRVDYIRFNFGGGLLDIFTTGAPGPSGAELDDPMIRLFVDDGSPIGALTGAFLAVSDDAIGLDPLISDTFAAGNYILAIGQWDLTESEARSGIASTPDVDRDYRTTFTTDAALTILPTAPIPEPSSWALMILGFGAMGAAARLRGRQTVSVAWS